MQRIGLISDTHGLLRPQALAALQDCAHIIHAGDIGDAQILAALAAALAPLTAVRGNNDRDTWASKLPDRARIEFAGMRIHVLHDVHDLAVDPRAANIAVVVSGHSHQPRNELRDGVLYVNPGSAGPRRFKLPVTVGELLIDGAGVTARIIELAP